MRSQRAALLGLLTTLLAACSATGPQTIHAPATQIRSVVVVSKSAGSHDRKVGRSSTSLVEESLHARGIRFGTDGSAHALFAFVSGQFPSVSVEAANSGDVLFFDVGDGCGGHAALVETVESTGRIGFREWRDGSSRHSYVTPRTPFVRRDDRGRILNTFLRPKRMEDPAGTSYFAGEMLCAVFHVLAP